MSQPDLSLPHLAVLLSLSGLPPATAQGAGVRLLLALGNAIAELASVPASTVFATVSAAGPALRRLQTSSTNNVSVASANTTTALCNLFAPLPALSLLASTVQAALANASNRVAVAAAVELAAGLPPGSVLVKVKSVSIVAATAPGLGADSGAAGSASSGGASDVAGAAGAGGAVLVVLIAGGLYARRRAAHAAEAAAAAAKLRRAKTPGPSGRGSLRVRGVNVASLLPAVRHGEKQTQDFVNPLHAQREVARTASSAVAEEASVIVTPAARVDHLEPRFAAAPVQTAGNRAASDDDKNSDGGSRWEDDDSGGGGGGRGGDAAVIDGQEAATPPAVLALHPSEPEVSTAIADAAAVDYNETAAPPVTSADVSPASAAAAAILSADITDAEAAAECEAHLAAAEPWTLRREAVAEAVAEAAAGSGIASVWRSRETGETLRYTPQAVLVAEAAAGARDEREARARASAWTIDTAPDGALF